MILLVRRDEMALTTYSAENGLLVSLCLVFGVNLGLRQPLMRDAR